MIESLEPRVLFSAAPIDMPVEAEEMVAEIRAAHVSANRAEAAEVSNSAVARHEKLASEDAEDTKEKATTTNQSFLYDNVRFNAGAGGTLIQLGDHDHDDHDHDDHDEDHHDDDHDHEDHHDGDHDHDHGEDNPIEEPLTVGYAEAQGNGSDSSIVWQNYDLTQTFALHSNPDAKHTIYLDFDGHTTTNTYWNNNYGSSIVTPAYSMDGNSGSFSNSEMARIQNVWAAVAEDFIPFDVNITTEDPGTEALRKSGSGDDAWGVRVVIGPNTWYSNAGGVAYIASFDWGTDTPAFVFNSGENSIIEAVTHEVGHALGLGHDGTATSGYYSGHGSGATSWGSIMGAAYGKSLTQWNDGTYAGADNSQDDLAIITSGNGFGYRADDFGDSFSGAHSLAEQGQSSFDLTYGIIERNTDFDTFSFFADEGAASIDINTVSNYYNLDILAELFDAGGNLISTSNPTNDVDASFNFNLNNSGEYFLRITGTGKGDPLNGGYTDYGSLGSYRITGDVVGFSGSGSRPDAGDDSASTEQNTPVTVNVLSNDTDPEGDTLSISSFAQGANGSVTLSGGLLTYTPDEGFIGNDSFTYTVSDGNGSADTATVDVTVLPVVPEDSKLQTGRLENIGTAEWTTVTLDQSYDSMVVVATPVLESGDPTLVTRIQNATGNSFQVMVQRADGSSVDVSGIQVQYVAVEEGKYNMADHGINMEAVKFTSTVTAENSNWVNESRQYLNSYNAPVVLGQVMSHNDDDFSAFWSSGYSRTDKPSSSTLNVGKHVGEDPDTTRADETIGYIVVESGTGTINGIEYSAGVGSDSVYGIDNGATNYTVAGLNNSHSAVVSVSGMDGADGGWAVLSGADPVGGNSISVSVNEDQLGDSERSHTSEEVAYLVFGLDQDFTAPTATISDVSTNYGNAGVVTIDFSESVSGVGISDFLLTRNGQAVDTTGLSLSGSGQNYSIDLSSVTQTAGNYVLTLVASGSQIQDDAGNLLVTDANDSWTGLADYFGELSKVSDGVDAASGANGADVVFRVDLKDSTGATVVNNTGSTITYSFTTGGSASSGSDYTTTQTVSVEDGQSFGTITISVINDDTVEATETILASISDASYGYITTGKTDASAQIVDLDVASVTLNDGTVSEDGTSLVFTATLDQAVDGGFTVDVDIAGVTATAGQDFTGNSQTLAFTGTAGEQRTVSIAINDDTETEDTETFLVSLSNLGPALVSAGSIDTSDVGTGTILDNDPAVNTAPELTDIDDVTVSPNAGGLTVTLIGTDADGDNLSYSAHVVGGPDPADQEAYDLDQQLNFKAGSSDFRDYTGQDERYFLTGGNVWHYVRPDGQVFRWGGSAAASVYVATVDSTYHADLTKFYDVEQPDDPTAGIQVAVNGDQLTVTHDAGYEGSFVVSVTASDGEDSDTMEFTVNVVDQGPSLETIDDQVIAGDATTVTLVGSGDYSVELIGGGSVDPADQAAYDLDQERNFRPGSSDYRNYTGQDERFVYSDTHGWHYILPDGDVYRWGGSAAASTYVASLDSSYHTDLTKLYNVEAPVSNAPDVQISIDGDQLTIDPAAGYSGEFTVRVTASDGTEQVSQKFSVTVTDVDPQTNTAPEIGDVQDQVIPAGGSQRVIDLGATDADGDALTFIVEATGIDATDQAAYDLDQQYDFYAGSSDYLNFTGQNERYILSNSGWYYVLPNGDFYKWGGSAAGSTYVETLDASYHADLTKFYNVSVPVEKTVEGVQFSIVDGQLIIDPDSDFVGVFTVRVRADDGRDSDETEFTVTVGDS